MKIKVYSLYEPVYFVLLFLFRLLHIPLATQYFIQGHDESLWWPDPILNQGALTLY